MQESFGGGSGFEQDGMHVVTDQLEELIVTIIEEIRERPAVAAAILAAVIGAVIGSLLATRGRGRQRPAAVVQAVRRGRGMGDLAEVAGLALKLLENPIVRGYVRSAVSSQVKKRFFR